MADANYYTKLQQKNQANASKFYSHFLYKALIVTIFLVIIPLFPSQAPEFINQSLNNRGWEFLHLLFVGIAVSYGLFSRRNDDTEKEYNNNNSDNSKFDNAQLYVSRFLQVSSVFDDEVENSSRVDGNKVQTWSNQYYRNEPVVVVAEEHSALEKEQIGSTSRTVEKPLLLPVRSLKSRVVDTDVCETSKESIGVSGSTSTSRSSSNLGSKKFSSNLSKSRNEEFGGLGYQELEDKLKDNVVLPSPIPWRSRSGRMEMKEEVDGPFVYTPPPSTEEPEHNRSFRAQVSRPARPNSASASPKLSPSPSISSPKKFSPSPSFSSEAQGKGAEDFVRKKSFYKSPPPPPPPPPPPKIRKSSAVKSSSSKVDSGVSVEEDVNRTFISEPKDVTRGSKSFRTFRSDDLLAEATMYREFENGIRSKANNRLKEVEASAMERAGRRMVGFEQPSFKTERLNHESLSFMPQTPYMEFPKEEEGEFVEPLDMESDEDSGIEEDDDIAGSAGSSFASGLAASSNKEEVAASGVSDGGPDVDKKADEFIAKFREQIRLQRIESIKKSSVQISKKASR